MQPVYQRVLSINYNTASMSPIVKSQVLNFSNIVVFVSKAATVLQPANLKLKQFMVPAWRLLDGVHSESSKFYSRLCVHEALIYFSLLFQITGNKVPFLFFSFQFIWPILLEINRINRYRIRYYWFQLQSTDFPFFSFLFLLRFKLSVKWQGNG